MFYYAAAMHPPPFRPHQRLSDWPKCRVEARCCGIALYPVQLLLGRYGDLTFDALIRRLRCSTCGGRAGPVYLCAGEHREHCNGAEPDWAIELVAAPPKRAPQQGRTGA